MFGLRWRLFRLFGIPISIDASWLIILALLTWTLISFFSIEVPGYTEGTYVLLGSVTALAFFGCIVLHELGHAIVAKRMGIPMRGITLFLFGGVAEMEDEPPSATSEFLMAIAGPAVSLVLAGLFFGLAAVGSAIGWPEIYTFPLGYLGFINAAVLIFNMVPAFPLDGGRVLRSALWAALNNLRKATLWASRFGQAFAFLLIVFGLSLLFANNIVAGIWFGIIGLFLNSAAQMSYQQVLIRQALHGEPLSRFTNTSPIVVSPTLDLASWVEDYVYRYHHKTYPVVADGRLEGVISTRNLSTVPREAWGVRTVGDVMERNIESMSLPPTADAMKALEKMKRSNLGRLLVAEDHQLIGLVSLKDLLRFLDLKLELDQGDESLSRSEGTVWSAEQQEESALQTQPK